MSNEDWRYSDERMILRAEAFIALKRHFNLKETRHLYEFCHDWVSQGNKSIVGIESHFNRYVSEIEGRTL